MSLSCFHKLGLFSMFILLTDGTHLSLHVSTPRPEGWPWGAGL